MSKQSKLGWIAAGVLALGWIGSLEPEPSSPPVSPTSVSRSNEVRPPPPEPTSSSQVPAIVATLLYATTNVRLRREPNTSAEIMWTVPAGSEVASHEQNGQWHRVTASSYDGWMHGDYLRSSKPQPQRTAAPPRPLPVVSPPSQDRFGQPRREPYVGTCDCPYDQMRNGRRCGGNSAYSRPGGRSPACYF
jgi:uncharacterized protein YraI